MLERMTTPASDHGYEVERGSSALAPHRGHEKPPVGVIIERGNILEMVEKPLSFDVVPTQYHKILKIIQNIFDASGVKAWAISGSMARHVHGYASSQPKDVDGFTTTAGLEALILGLKKNENHDLLNDLGLIMEEEDLDSEEYGKCKRVHIYSTNKQLPKDEAVDIEFFGEGSVEGYGGTSALDNPAVENKIMRSSVGELGSENTFDVQYFSKEVLTRWYTLVYGREMANFAKKLFEPENKNHDNLKVKIANRFVALLTLFGEQYGKWPDGHNEQMDYLVGAFGGMLRHIQDLKKYKNLPAESMNIVINMESYVQMVVNELEVEKAVAKYEPEKKAEYIDDERVLPLLKNVTDIANQNREIDVREISGDISKINLEKLSHEELQEFYDNLTTISLNVSNSNDSIKLVEFIGILEQIRDNNSPLRNLFIKVPLLSHLKAVIAGRKYIDNRLIKALEDSDVVVEMVDELERKAA